MEPEEPTERMEPEDAIDKMEPAEAIDRIEPTDAIDKIDPVDAVEQILRTESRDLTDQIDVVAESDMTPALRLLAVGVRPESAVRPVDRASVPVDNLSDMSDQILDVDLLAFETGSSEQRRAVVDGVTRSLATGFVYTSHDLSEDLLDTAYGMLREFFRKRAG